MSHEGSTKDSNSQSESSSSSANQSPFFQEHYIKETDFTDLTLYGSAAPTITRTGTVRRVSSAPLKKDKDDSIVVNNDDITDNYVVVTKNERSASVEKIVNTHKYRRSLDSTFRHSLDSISEHKTRRSFSPTSLLTNTSRECSSLDSCSSDYTDHAQRSNSDILDEREKTIHSPSSSYLTWIESVNSEYFGSAISTTEVPDVDSKVGEWNNFWLNYNNARGQYMSSPYLSAEDRMGDDVSDVKSTCSTQKELTDKNSSEYISLNLEEIHEAAKCALRITEILQNALKRNDQDVENMNLENSFYSEPLSRQNSCVREEFRETTKEDVRRVTRDRSMSYAVTSQEILKQKELLKPAAQSSSTSCINAILNTGVADILKRVMNKRREVISPDEVAPRTRSSFSEWSSK